MAVLATASRVRCVFRSDLGSLTSDLPTSETSRWRAIARVLRSPVDAVSCALLPAFCSLCGSPLPRLSSVPICAACWAEIPGHTAKCCVRCGDMLAAHPSSLAPSKADLCRACRLAPPPFVRAVAVGPYQGRLREALHALKYDGLRPAARGLGQGLAHTIARLAPEGALELLVVPVPLHRSKFSDRGFNQARLLAAEAIAALHATHPQWRLTLAPDTLIRLRATQSQAGLTPRQRRQNVRGAFGVSNPSTVQGKHTLIVDDILTTGATARACAHALLAAGAESVWVATLARAHRAYGTSDGFAVDPDRQTTSESMAGNVSDFPTAFATMNGPNQPSF